MNQEKINNFVKKYVNYIILGFLILVGLYIRSKSIPILKGKYLIEQDAYLFLRYTEYIVEHGKIMSLDLMRNYPAGFDPQGENILISYILAYFYKIIHFFIPNLTISELVILYPLLTFIISIILFYLLVKKLTNSKISLIATAYLIVIPPFIQRTMAGFSDKEPMGILLMFLTFYLYITALQSKTIKHEICFGILAGISTGLMGLIWGGVQFVLIIIPMFILIELILDRITNKEIYIYIPWIFFSILILTTLTQRYPAEVLFKSISITLGFFILTWCIIYYLIINYKIKKLEKYDQKLPKNIQALIITIISGAIFSSLIFSPTFLINNILDFLNKLINPIGKSRLISTISEAQKTYIVDWLKEIGNSFYLIIISAILLFYNLVRPITKYKSHLTIIFSITLISILYTHYSPTSEFNGQTSISLAIYLTSIFLFALTLLTIYLVGYFKDKELISQIKEINTNYMFIFVWFIASLISVRGGIRLLFVISPVITILFGYTIKYIYDYIFKTENNTKIIIGWLILITIILTPSTVLSIDTSGSLLSFSTSMFNLKIDKQLTNQWINALLWIKDNTPENSVIASWWDYGYGIQTVAERPTILDGGNTLGAWNHLYSRKVLTNNNNTEALEFLKSHNASHLIINYREIQIYNSFSLLASNKDLDKESNIYKLELKEIKETRKGKSYYFNGGIPTDETFNYNKETFLKGTTGIPMIKIDVIEEQNQTKFMQPIAIFLKDNKNYEIPLNCLYYNNKKEIYNNGIDSCLLLIPSIRNDGTIFPLSIGLYLSPKVKNTLFTNLYLFEEEVEGFKLIYNDESLNFNLGYYAPQSIIVGPIKIWEISYKDTKFVGKNLIKSYPKDVPH